MPCKGSTRIQKSGDRIQNKVFAFGSAGKYKLCRREATSFYSDFWLLNSEFQHRLSLKALSKGKPKPGPLALQAVGSVGSPSWKPGRKPYGLEAGPGFITFCAFCAFLRLYQKSVDFSGIAHILQNGFGWRVSGFRI